MEELGLLTLQNKVRGERDCHLQLPGQRFAEERETEASQTCRAIGQEAKDVGWKEGNSGLV